MHLKKQIGIVGLMFSAIGGIVGSGWLFGPFYAAKIAGPAAIFAWLLGGLLMIVIALTFAELASAFPVAGGMARFAQLSHGTLVSFTMSWIGWLAAVMVAPIETMAGLQYAANYIPNIANVNAHPITLTPLGLGFAALIMFVLCWVNMLGVKYFSKSNIAIVSWKLIIPVCTIIFLFTHSFSHQNFHSQQFMPYGIRSLLVALPTAGVIFSFIGYSPAIQLAQEAKNPQRAIPIAILGAITGCIVLYMVLQYAFVGALNPSTIANGWQNLRFSGDAGPIAGILSALGIIWFVKLLYLDAVVSPFGTAYIYTAATARMNYAMSQNGYMPDWLRDLNQKSVPAKAMLANFFVGMIFFLPFPGWQAMVSFLVSCFVLAYAVGPLACVALRVLEPDVHRPFKLPGHRTLCLLAFYICTLLVYWTGWNTVWRMLTTIGIGYCVLFGYRWYHQKRDPIDWQHGFWLFPYLIGIGLISYLGNFNGIGWITFGWDFAVIAVFSGAIFLYAQCNVRRPAS